MSLKFLLSFFIFSLQGLAYANGQMTSERRLFFDRLNTLEMEVVDEKSTFYRDSKSDYPFFARMLQWDLLKYSPSGLSKSQVKGCDFHELSEKILSPMEDTAAPWWSAIEDSFKVCLPSWQTTKTAPWINALGMLTMKLDVENYPFGRHVVFHIPGGVKVKGFLAMKTDAVKRPFVILRSGIFSNSQEFFPERAFFIQLFEQSPFHVLLLESTSGTEFIQHNRSLAFGGFDEGIHTLWIAQLLKDPDQPISKFIDSIHTVGISLGGHGVFVANWLKEFNRTDLGTPIIQSSLLFCPLVQFAETLEFHRGQDFSMQMMNYWASRRLTVLKERYPQLTPQNFIQDFLGILNSQYLRPAILAGDSQRSIRLPENVDRIFSDSKDVFWKLNNFWPLLYESLPQPISTPTLIFATTKDPIVPLILNSGKFLNGQLNSNILNAKVFQLQEGYHCSLQIAYDWSLFSTVMNSFIMKMSPQFKVQKKEARFPIPAEILSRISGKEVHLNLDFVAKKGKTFVSAEVRFDDQFWPTWKEKLAAPKVRFEIPLKELEFPFQELPQKTSEIDLIERWARQNVSARLENNSMLLQWQVAPP